MRKIGNLGLTLGLVALFCASAGAMMVVGDVVGTSDRAETTIDISPVVRPEIDEPTKPDPAGPIKKEESGPTNSRLGF